MPIIIYAINLLGGPPRGNASQRGPNRGNQRGPSSRGRYQSNRKVESPLKFEGEFDFEEANAQFDKDEIERELKEKLTIGKFYVICILGTSVKKHFFIPHSEVKVGYLFYPCVSACNKFLSHFSRKLLIANA